MKNFIVIRAQKCAAWGDGNKAAKIRGVEGQTKHDLRLIETRNADPARREENLICSSDTGWKLVRLTHGLAAEIGADRADFFSAKAKERMGRLGIAEPQRADVVRTINFIAAVSPEWLRNGDEARPLDMKKARQFSEAAAGFFRMKYGENFLGCIIHMDELNPHCSAYVLPAVHMVRRAAGRPRKEAAIQTPAQPAASWGLRAKSLLTPDQRVKSGDKRERIYGSGTCSQLQTEFTDFCRSKGMNVVRGIHGSRAKHKSIAEHNHLLRSAVVLEENIAAIDDVEKLRRLARQNLLKARAHDDSERKHKASIEAERRAREEVHEMQQRLIASARSEAQIEHDLRAVLVQKEDGTEVLRQLLDRLQKQWRISLEVLQTLVGRSLLYANRLGHLVVHRIADSKIVGQTVQDPVSRKVWQFGSVGRTPVLRPGRMTSIVVAPEPLEALAIATCYGASADNKRGVDIGRIDSNASRAALLKLAKPNQIHLALPEPSAEQHQKNPEGFQILRPPEGHRSWLEFLQQDKSRQKAPERPPHPEGFNL
jgi:hypothetical protein